METESISIFLGCLLINFSIFSLCPGIIQAKPDSEMQQSSPHSWFFSCFDLLPCYCFIRSKSLKALTWIVVKISGTWWAHMSTIGCLVISVTIPTPYWILTITRTLLILYTNHLKGFLKDWVYCVINVTIFPPQTCWNICIQVSFVL